MSSGSASKKGPSEEEINHGIEQMYKIYEKLNSASDKTTLEGEFRELLQAVKRSDKEKRLASQFITRFLEFFPLLYNEAIDAMLDLCEDDDVSIRKLVCKDLITVSKKVSAFVPKIADVYGQLMQTDDTSELNSIQSCLVSLLHIDAQAALVGIFSQIVSGEFIVRERCLKFLSTKLKDLSPDIVDAGFERCLMSEARRSVSELSGEHFKQLFDLLMTTKLLKTVTGQQSLVDLIGELLEMDKDFDASEAENFHKLIMCSRRALLLFSSQVSGSQFLQYYCNRVLPNIGEAIMIEDSSAVKLEALMMMADIAVQVKQMDQAEAGKCLQNVYNNLLELLPLPPEEDDLRTNFEFSQIECLLYTLHKLGEFNEAFLGADPDKLKDFRIRLQYLARATQAYMRALREDLQGKKGDELRMDINRKKIVTLKLTTNISAVIKDFFHTPPSYRSTIGLSWRPLPRLTATPKKRPATDTSLAVSHPQSKEPRGDKRIYQPPSGKFSSRAGAYSSPPPRGARGASRGYRGSRRGRGGMRGY